jgi:hypothetical protein
MLCRTDSLTIGSTPFQASFPNWIGPAKHILNPTDRKADGDFLSPLAGTNRRATGNTRPVGRQRPRAFTLPPLASSSLAGFHNEWGSLSAP